MTWTLKQGLLNRSIVFAVCIVGAMGYMWFAAKAYQAQWFADKLDRPSIEKAVALAPLNATYHEQLCRSIIFGSEETERAVDECKRASELNPYSSSIWLDLAQAY